MKPAMLFLAAAPGLFAGTPQRAVYAAEETGSVHVALQRGRLSVVPSADGDVNVEVKKLANAQRCHVLVAKKGRTVLVLAKTKSAMIGSGTVGGASSAFGPLQVPRDPSDACEVDIRLAMPAATPLSVGASHAQLRVAGRIGRTEISIAHAKLRLAHVRGPLTVSARKSDVTGDVATSNAEISASGGGVDLGWRRVLGDGRIAVSSMGSIVRLSFPSDVELSVDRSGMLSGFRRDRIASPSKPVGRLSLEISGIGGLVSLATTKS